VSFHNLSIELLRSRADEWISISAGLLCRRTPAGKIEAKTATANPPLMEDRQVDLGNKPNQIEFGSLTIGWSFLNSSKIPLRRREGVEYFDSEAVGPSIVLRHWRNGDRFQPIGMGRAAKLQDLFVNQKIPRAFRHQLAIATTAGGEIFWVQGLRLGERFKVTSATKRLLRWSWR